MLKFESGDLLKSNCTVIMHQCNCFNKMGAGIAKSISKMYPSAYQVDRDFHKKGIDRLGDVSYYTSNGVTVVNLYGQYQYGSNRVQTNYEALEKSIDKFLELAKRDKRVNLSKIGVPYRIGAGLAGGDWNVILDILGRQSSKHNLDFYIYKL